VKPPGSSINNDTKVKTLLQNIEVLSAGQNYQKDAEGKPVVVPVVNLPVTPEQAELLSLASNETRIQLVLRNPLDRELAKPTGSALASLFGETAKAPAAPRPRTVPAVAKKAAAAEVKPAVILLPDYQIEVLNGPKRSEIKFQRRPEEQKQ
jgi:pilus assembly protein CpaB